MTFARHLALTACGGPNSGPMTTAARRRRPAAQRVPSPPHAWPSTTPPATPASTTIPGTPPARRPGCAA